MHSVASFSVAGLIIDSAAKAIKKSNEVAEKGNLDELKAEADRQEIESRISELQARVAQELAIARRIENAFQVEIEEFYDASGEGNIGANAKEGTFSLGANGAGRKVTRRVYRF